MIHALAGAAKNTKSVVEETNSEHIQIMALQLLKMLL